MSNIWINVSDLIVHVKRAKGMRVRGIPRVILNYAYYGCKNHNFRACIYCNSTSMWYEIDSQVIYDIYNQTNIDKTLSFIKQCYVTHCKHTLCNIVHKYKSKFDSLAFHALRHILTFRWLNVGLNPHLKLISFNGGDVLFNSGLSHHNVAIFDTIERNKRDLGIKLYSLVHDIIPISNNGEYHAFIYCEQFARYINRVINASDKIFTVSDFTKNEVMKYFKLSTDNIHTVPLGNNIIANGLVGTDVLLSNNLERKKYIMMVSTIEVRKNHIGLVKAWRNIVKNNKNNGCKLVIVGAIGWQISEFLQYIKQNAADLDGNFVILNRIQDRDLSSLYKNCLFTVFPSFMEGYGLPIVESFMNGKLCITSNVSSMPEVGGEYADYVNPRDISTIEEKISFYINNPEALAAKEEKIKSAKFSSWEEATSVLADFINEK